MWRNIRLREKKQRGLMWKGSSLQIVLNVCGDVKGSLLAAILSNIISCCFFPSPPHPTGIGTSGKSRELEGLGYFLASNAPSWCMTSYVSFFKSLAICHPVTITERRNKALFGKLTLGETGKGKLRAPHNEMIQSPFFCYRSASSLSFLILQEDKVVW